MIPYDELVSYLDQELRIEHYKNADGAKYNGVLVKGTEEVERIGLCTNCTFETIEAAAQQGCDVVISHHGGWETFDGDLLAEKKDRIAEEGMTWYIAHEPLDCADEYGISAALMDRLGISVEGAYGEHAGGNVGRYGTLEVSQEEFLDRIAEIDSYEVIDSEGRELEELDFEDARIGVIGGSAGVFQPLIDATIQNECDLFITGNAAFFGKIHAYERGLTMVTLEETSSERWGVYALGEHLNDEFGELDLVRLEERNW